MTDFLPLITKFPQKINFFISEHVTRGYITITYMKKQYKFKILDRIHLSGNWMREN